MTLTKMQKKAMNHDISLSMTAGAGTGKTRVLVEKYLDILDKVEDAKISNILALTYTEKAAAEMKERIIKEIRKRNGLDHLKEEMIHSNISTIHSFCSHVIRSFPLEIGIDPGYHVLEEADEKRLIDDAISEIFNTDKHPDIIKNVIGLFEIGSEFITKKMIEELYVSRSVLEGHKSKFFSHTRKEMIDEWRGIIIDNYTKEAIALMKNIEVKSALDDLSDLARNYAGDDTERLQILREFEKLDDKFDMNGSEIQFMKAVVDFCDNISSKNLGRTQNPLTKDDAARLSKAKKFLDTEFGNLQFEFRKIVEDDLDVEQVYDITFGLLTVYKRFYDVIERRKRSMNCIDFTDMISIVNRFFNEQEEIVNEHYADRFRYVLLDEFQDTDPAQWSIMLKLVGGIVPGNERLFIVGDPKQSIYRFRKADVTLFKKARRFITSDLCGENHDLDVNFRSTPAVIDFVNYLFRKLLIDNGNDWEFDYEDLHVSDRRKNDTGSVEVLLQNTDKGSANEVQNVLNETDLVAARIKEIVTKKDRMVYWDERGEHIDEPREPTFGDITILLRTNSHLRLFEHSLREYGIPYHIHGGLGFWEKQEVLDLCNILEYLNNPSDDLSLFGILRSPYFGRSDQELVALWRSKGGDIIEKMRGIAGYEQEIELLTKWNYSSRRITPTELVWMIISDSEIYSVYGSMKGTKGEQAIGNVEKFIAKVRNAQSDGFRSLPDLVKMLKTIIDDPPKDGEAQLDIESGDNVTIMTVHKSKGLEFPIVIVPDMYGNPGSHDRNVTIDDKYGISVKIPNDKEGSLTRNSMMKELADINDRNQENAEYKRLFYVACTRAKDHLILSGIKPKEVTDSNRWVNFITWAFELDDVSLITGNHSYELNGEIMEFEMIITNDVDGKDDLKEKIEPSLIEIPEDLEHSEKPGPIVLEDREDEHVFSPSEIKMLMEEPEKHRNVYVLGAPDQVITRSRTSVDDSAVRGSIIHEVFEGKSPKMVLKKFGIIDSSLEKEYQGMYDRFMASDIMKDLNKDLKELSFRITVEGITLSGFIDRAIQHNDGSWSIIDYKTNKVTQEDKQKKANEYALQLSVYREALRQIFGVEADTFIYLSEIDEFVEVEEIELVSIVSKVIINYSPE